jgi:hypothetical protein
MVKVSAALASAVGDWTVTSAVPADNRSVSGMAAVSCVPET